MLLIGDYHTHTNFSRNNHGKNTILENAVLAKSKGLKEIAITDHGYGHIFYGVKRKKVGQALQEIEEAKNITGINILHGVEANFISCDGTLDIKDGDYEKLDILLAGFHELVWTKTIKDFFVLILPNMLLKNFKPSKKRVERNTQTILNALNKYDIDVITHLGHKMPVDIKPIAELAKEKGTYIELNGSKCNFTDSEMKILLESGVKFIVNSDAHKSLDVGKCDRAINYIVKYGIEDRVVNLNDLPKFKKVRR